MAGWRSDPQIGEPLRWAAACSRTHALGSYRLLEPREMSRFVLATVLTLGVGSPAVCQNSPRIPLSASPPAKLSAPISRDSLGKIELLKLRPEADAMGAVQRNAARDTLEAQRTLWLRRRPLSYLVRTYEISHCIHVRVGTLLRDQLRVRDTALVGRVPTSVPAEFAQRCERDFRVEDLFADVARALSDSSTAVRVLQYDPTYGFPRYYSLRPANGRAITILVESFAPAP